MKLFKIFEQNKNIKECIINFTLPVSIDFTNLLKSGDHCCLSTMTQYIMHIANHFSAVLFLSRNTPAHRANY